MMIGPSVLVEKTHLLSLSNVTNEIPSVPAHGHASVESKHPFVQLLWEMLEKGIPECYAKEVSCVPSLWCQKSTTYSVYYRNLGSRSYDLRNFDQAMLYYSKSVAFAPDDSEELAAAYGYRSAIQLFRKNYELCLLDLNRALDGSLPQSTRQILLKRKAMAWEKLQEQNVLRSKLREGISHVKRSDDEKANLRACERQLCYISEVGIDDVDLVIDHSLIDDPIWQTKFSNIVFENMSPKIELKYDARLGPHLVAKDNIDPGETLCIDDLYSLAVFEQFTLKYCGYCYMQCESLIACPHCCLGLYCSKSCREKAYDSYHYTECKILPLWSNLPYFCLERRLVILRTFLRITKQGSKLDSLMNSQSVRESLLGKLNSLDPHVSHENHTILLNAVSILRYSKHENMAYTRHILKEILPIFAALRHVQFFGNEEREIQCSGNILNAQEYFGSMLLVYHVLLIRPQVFRVEDVFVESLAVPYKVTKTTIGYGFSPLKCFTHHSCDPNVHRIVNKRRMLMYSIRSIQAGEQIASTSLIDSTQATRKEQRAQYHGLCGQACTCKACVEDWPVLAELMKHKNKYHIRDKKMIAKIERMGRWLNRRQFSSISKDDLKTAIEFSKTLRQYVKEPSAIVHQFENYIMEVMTLKGNLCMDLKYIASLCNDL